MAFKLFSYEDVSMTKRVLLALAVSAALAPVSAFADASSVAKSCAAGGNCAALVNAEIARLGNECRVKDKGIADLVIAIGNESQRVTPEARQNMAGAVDLAAQSVCDVAQQTRIRQVAAAMRTNQNTQTAAVDTTDAGAVNGEQPDQASAN
jgi:hypothetical protein